MKYRINLYRLREEREMSPQVLSNLCMSLLYERRFGPYFVEPIIAGLNDNNEPYLCAMDLIGAPLFTNNFVVGGTCTEALYGMCETLWKSDMEADQLFETAAQCLLSAQDRDALSGWGAVVHVITPTQIITRHLKARQD